MKHKSRERHEPTGEEKKMKRDNTEMLDHYADCIRRGVHVSGTQMRTLLLELHAAQQPPAEAQANKWEALIGKWQARAEAAGYEGVEGALEAAEAQGGGEVVGAVEMHGRCKKVRLLRHDVPVGTKLYTAPPSASVGPHTYASTQTTKCAGCGEHKHTPLWNDAMGGYVCLTCIDQKLGSLLGEFGYPPSAPVGVESEPGAVRSLVAAANAVLALYPGDDLLWTLESAVRPFNATKPAECAGGCPPQQVCDYCQIASHAQQPAAVGEARPLDEWYEDDGPVVWWKLPVDEPAWIGTPLDSDWPEHHTHWTPHPSCPPNALAGQQGEKYDPCHNCEPLDAPPSAPEGVEAYLVERLRGEGYGNPRSIIDAAIYDPTKPVFWISPEAQAQHRVTPLVPALATQPAAVDWAMVERLALAHSPTGRPQR